MRLRRDDDGAAAVEFALIAPLIFILLFGIIVFGMGFYTQQGAAAAAREAARRAAVGAITSCTWSAPSNPPDLTRLPNVVQNTAPGAYGNTIAWNSSNMPTLAITPPDANGDQTVTVTVPYRVDLSLLTGFIPFATKELDLSATANAYVESQQSNSVTSC